MTNWESSVQILTPMEDISYSALPPTDCITNRIYKKTSMQNPDSLGAMQRNLQPQINIFTCRSLRKARSCTVQTLAVITKWTKVTPTCSAFGSAPDLSVALMLALLEKCADEPASWLQLGRAGAPRSVTVAAADTWPDPFHALLLPRGSSTFREMIFP